MEVLKILSKQGVRDIFLNYLAFNTHGKNELSSWIMKANSFNIKIHIRIQVFYKGMWINPEDTDINSLVEEAKKYASKQGVT